MLVTGGAGFIGSNFVRYSRKHHPDVHIIVLDALTYAGNLANIADVISGTIDKQSVIESSIELGRQPSVEFIRGSINDVQLVRSVMSQVDTVVHFAAESHNDRAIAHPHIFFETNVMGTLNLVQAATEYAVRFHHISTDEVYGDTDIDSLEQFTENSPYKPSSPYAVSKAASDHMVRAWARTYGLEATISNCSNNFGPYQHIEKFIPRAITNALSGLPIKLYGDGRAVRDWIHVEDQCAAIWTILEAGKIGETYLIGAQCDVSNEFVVSELQKILPNARVEHVRDRLGADRRYAIDASKIENDLGWAPEHTHFAEELMNTVRWYDEHRAWWESAKNSVEEEYARSGQ